MDVLAILVLCFRLIQGKVIFERIDHIDNLDYYTANVSVANHCGRSVINSEVIMFKTWDLHLTLRIRMYAMGGNRPRLMVAFPKLPYCDVMRTSKDIPVPMVSHLIKQLPKFGNFSVTCPIEKSYRYVQNYYVEDEDIPLIKSFLPDARYMMQVLFDDENGKKPISIIRGKIFFKYVKNK